MPVIKFERTQGRVSKGESELMLNRTIGTGGLVMMLVLALAAVGIGIALWSKVLTINGIVQTGSVNAQFLTVFTDDDDEVNNPDLDAGDTGDCPIHASPLPGPTSCDPKETGAEGPNDVILHRYDKDVARCDATAVPDGQDNETQPGSQLANVAIRNGYPSYHCTAWFLIENNGTIPIHLHSVSIGGVAATLCQLGNTAYDLNADTQLDIEICLSGLQPCTTADCPEPQVHPGETLPLDLDMHIMQTADQDTVYEFQASICFHQWNEETGNCPDAAHDTVIDMDGFASASPGGAADKDVAFGDALHGFPNSGADPRCGLDHFDNDGNGEWTFGPNGDDLHCESSQCHAVDPSPARHDAGEDCVVLDVNGSLVDQQPVNCDLDFFLADPIGAAPGSVCPPKLAYHDVNGNGVYDNGEDIVYDGNNNLIYD
jgi:hypothetical protein